MSQYKWTGWVVLAGVAIGFGACGTEDEGGDTNVMTIADDGSGDADDGSAGDGADDNGGSGSGGVDGDDGNADSTSGGGADDTPMDDGADDGAACDPACLPDEQCIAGNCVGGADDDGMDTGAAECGTNVSTMNPACDECAQGSCCDQLQACFGDETVMMNTPCLDLNNCIAMNCADSTTAKELQTCVNENCEETADQFNTWVAFIQCVGMNCQAQCAG